MYDPNKLYEDPVLTGFSVGYQDQTLHGEEFFPVTPVDVQSGSYRVFDRSAWLMWPDRREPGTVANEIQGGKWSSDVFSVKEHMLQAPVHDEERQNLASSGGIDVGINPDRDAIELVTRALLLRHEFRVSTVLRDVNTYPTGNKVTLTGTARWNDYGMTSGAYNSNPVADIRTGIRKIQRLTGRNPNVFWMTEDVRDAIENHPAIVARYTNFSLLDEDAWRTLTGFQGRVVIVESQYNAANHVDAAAQMTSFWGEDAGLAIVDAQPGQRTITFGKTFAQRYGNGQIRETARWREESRKTDVHRVGYKYDLKVVSNMAGYLFKTAIDPVA